MFNHTTNSQQFNENFNIPTELQGKIVFDGFSLSSLCSENVGVMIKKMNNLDVADIDISQFISWIDDGWGIFNRRYEKKELRCEFVIVGNSYEDLLTRIDEFKRRTKKVEWLFEFMYNWEVRTYVATVSNWPKFDELKRWWIQVEWEITFLILSPHRYKKSPTSYIFEDITSLSYTESIDNKGTYKVYPRIVFGFRSAGNNSISKISLEIKKIGEIVGYTVDYPATVGNGDIVVFDFKNYQINHNSLSNQKFNGVITALDDGISTLEFTFSWTSVNCDIAIFYNEIYL